jgi:hypothetical protein
VYEITGKSKMIPLRFTHGTLEFFLSEIQCVVLGLNEFRPIGDFFFAKFASFFVCETFRKLVSFSSGLLRTECPAQL